MLLRTPLLKAADSAFLQRQVTSRRVTRNLALRYVAGETLDEGLAVTRTLAAQGRSVTFDYLGEAVSTEDEARAASKIVLEAIDRIGQEQLPAGVSVKPTQMGLERSPELCAELLDEICQAAGRIGQHVTFDMEGSSVTEPTVAMVERLRATGHGDVGCAVQSYLYRTRADVERLTAAGASLRLCKGAYAEPPEVAFQSRAEVDISYADCATYLLERGVYPRIATHDVRLIDHVKRTVARLGKELDDFEFQMLYGVRASLQDALVNEGYRLRVYVPFGHQWYPYFMRRLAERPANIIFFLRSLRDT
ncbi:MAG: proline dehydrogenase family protein [Egibacteraceae bacterium]